MNIIIVKNAVEGGHEGYKLFAEAKKNGAHVFGLATGSTPITTYQEIVASDLDFSDSISINLDEYVGLAADNEQSYNYFMHKNLFNQKPFKQSYLPNGLAEDLEAEAKRYDKIIADNPIDLQILGIGRNGHIGFNEPGTPQDSKTHRVALTQSTIDANARFFEHEEDVPKEALSMGLASIMQSKHILLEAYGEDKADAIKGMIEGPNTPDLPASILQGHGNVTVILDEAAASKLTNK
ncbi:glucosamine-6-phosphate deaminase [Pediococcus siamensis]|uniref:glucosamine-6-phosphate deaminase n=1 Tax=Pediococcus siamensis TaxID=381829 RepID=UPI0039A17EAB